jgi:hypothetical protein
MAVGGACDGVPLALMSSGYRIVHRQGSAGGGCDEVPLAMLSTDCSVLNRQDSVYQ